MRKSFHTAAEELEKRQVRGTLSMSIVSEGRASKGWRDPGFSLWCCATGQEATGSEVPSEHE